MTEFRKILFIDADVLVLRIALTDLVPTSTGRSRLSKIRLWKPPVVVS